MTVSAPERTGKSESIITPAPNPRFIVQHTTRGHWQIAQVGPDATGRSFDGIDYTDETAVFAERDRLNEQHWALAEIDERLRRLPRQAHVLALFESAETQEHLAQILKAYADGAMFRFVELVEDFDRAYAEATAGL